MADRCEIPRCRDEAGIAYLGHGLCDVHWNELTNENASADALRMALGIEAAPEPMEEVMSKKKTEKNATASAEIESTAEVKTETKLAKKTKPDKTATKKERTQKESGLVVFAFRLTEAERDAIHKAAGPALASRFVRTIAAAAARDDVDAIKTLIRDARQAAQ